MPKKNIKLAKTLRKKMTEAERKLWGRLKTKQIEGLRFRRQEPIGEYIVDFACYEKRIIIELDGDGHLLKVEKDNERDDWFSQHGFKVLRFWNQEVLGNLEGVLVMVWNACNHPPPSPLPSREGELEHAYFRKK
jgi:very-short-patch-repair endonuclease